MGRPHLSECPPPSPPSLTLHPCHLSDIPTVVISVGLNSPTPLQIHVHRPPSSARIRSLVSRLIPGDLMPEKWHGDSWALAHVQQFYLVKDVRPRHYENFWLLSNLPPRPLPGEETTPTNKSCHSENFPYKRHNHFR